MEQAHIFEIKHPINKSTVSGASFSSNKSSQVQNSPKTVDTAATTPVSPAAHEPSGETSSSMATAAVEVGGGRSNSQKPTPVAAVGEQCTVAAVGRFVETVARSNNIADNELDDPSCFHAVSIPHVSLVSYLQRLQNICKISNEAFVLSLIYVDRVVSSHSNVRLNMLTVHRIALAAAVIAAKFFEDIFYTNGCYARAGGVSLQELNGLEECLLRLLQFTLYVTPEEYEEYKHLCFNLNDSRKE